jgi:L-rhamnose mutarotase
MTTQRLAPTLLLSLGVLVWACQEAGEPRGTAPVAPDQVQRFAWVTGLDPEKAAYYEELHANPWPEVMARLTECNIRNFSIHKREIAGKLYLFAYLEYTGHDFEADMKKMADDPHTQRWWKETDPCQIPLPDAAAAGKIWADTQEIFYHP